MGPHLDGLSLRLPFTPAVFEIADQLLLLGVHRDHGLTLLLVGVYLRVDVLELGVAVDMSTALAGLAIGLQAVAERVQQFGDLLSANRMPLFPEHRS